MTASNRSGAAPTFLSLQQVHQALDDLFLRHQEALFALDVASARRLLCEFEEGIRLHMQVEECALLPVYRRAGHIPGGGPNQFIAEHRKIMEMLLELTRGLETLDASAPDAKRRVIRLFDEAARFKSLLEHHDLREQNLLYPTLDRVTSPEERRELLARCAP